MKFSSALFAAASTSEQTAETFMACSEWQRVTATHSLQRRLLFAERPLQNSK
ncbi:hypothetical protein A2U01_0000976, partial [Trifolium medium]|nr:hypothetical protein [Trifolium medium]